MDCFHNSNNWVFCFLVVLGIDLGLSVHPEFPASVVQRDSQCRITEFAAYGSRALGRSEGKRKQTLDISDTTTFHQGFADSLGQASVPASKQIPIDTRLESTSKSVAEPVLSDKSRGFSKSYLKPFDLNVELGLDGKPIKKIRRDDHHSTRVIDRDPFFSDIEKTAKFDVLSCESKPKSQSNVHQLAQRGQQGQIHPKIARNVSPSTKSRGEHKLAKLTPGIKSNCKGNDNPPSESEEKLITIFHQQWSGEDLEKPNIPSDGIARPVIRVIPRRVIAHFAQPFLKKLRDAISGAGGGLLRQKTNLKNDKLAKLDVELTKSDADEQFTYYGEDLSNSISKSRPEERIQRLVRSILSSHLILLQDLNVPQENYSKQCNALFSWLQLEMFHCTDSP